MKINFQKQFGKGTDPWYAKADAWLFGDYDAYESYDINTKKVSEEDESV